MVQACLVNWCYAAGASVKKAAGAVEKLASGGGLPGYSWRQRGTDPHEVDVSDTLETASTQTTCCAS
jgi:hypothetical protein